MPAPAVLIPGLAADSAAADPTAVADPTAAADSADASPSSARRAPGADFPLRSSSARLRDAIGYREVIRYRQIIGDRGYRAVRARQPHPARLCSRPAAAAVSHHLSPAPAEPSVPGANAGPLLGSYAQPDLRSLPVAHRHQDGSVPPNGSLELASYLGRW